MCIRGIVKLKYFCVATVALCVVYFVVDFTFVRGHLVNSSSGEIVELWDNQELRFKGGPSITHAVVKLKSGMTVNAICKSSCMVGANVIVEKYEPIIGWSANYYVKSGI